MNEHWTEVLERMKQGFHADMASETGIAPGFIEKIKQGTARRIDAGKRGHATRLANAATKGV